MAAHVNHAGTTTALAHKQLGRRTNLGERQQQRHVLTLEQTGKVLATRVRGYANAYRVLLPWVLAMIDGEKRAGEVPIPTEAERPSNAAASAQPSSPTRPRPPWWLGDNLEHHPSL